VLSRLCRPVSVLAVAFSVAACSFGSVPATEATADPSAVTQATRLAVTTYYTSSMVPPGLVPGALTTAQAQGLRSQIIAEFQSCATGPFLLDRLSAMLDWADAMESNAAVRTSEADVLRFDSRIVNLTNSTATVSGHFQVHQVNARGVRASLTTWGGTLDQDYVAILQLTDGGWRVSSLEFHQTNFAPDATSQPAGATQERAGSK